MSVMPTSLDTKLAELLRALNSPQLTPAQRGQLEDQAEGLVNRGASQAVAQYLTTGTTSPAGTPMSTATSATSQADLAQNLSAALNPTAGQFDLSGTALSPQWAADMLRLGLTPQQIQDSINYNRQWEASPQMQQDYSAQRTAEKAQADQFVSQLRAIQAMGNTPEAAQRLAAISQQGTIAGVTPEQAQENVRAVAASQLPQLTPSTAQREFEAGRTPTVATTWTGLPAQPDLSFARYLEQAAGTTTGTTGGTTGGAGAGTGVTLTTTGDDVPEVKLPTYEPTIPAQVDTSVLGTAGPHTGITTPAYTPVQAPTQDLSALKAQAGQVPEMKLPTYAQQTPSAVDLSALRQAGPQTAITAPAYTPPSTGELRGAIGGMTSITTPTATTPQTFMAPDVQKAIAAQAQGQAPAPMQAQFGTPEQFGQYVAQTQQMLQPYTDAQKQAATAAFNQAMQKLGGQWAARGMLASGAAAGAQQQAAQGFGIQMGLLEAQQLEQAINTALQSGRMSMEEAQAIQSQLMQGAQFGQQQAVTQAQLLQNALAEQEQRRLAEQGLGLDVQRTRSAQEQARVAALQSALGLETQQVQFGAGLDLQTQQTEMQRQQMLADNLARSMGMDIGQRQFGAEFTAQQQRDIFGQALASEQLSQQQRQAAQDALMNLAQMEQQQGQFGAQLGVQQEQFAANLGLAVQQAEAQRQQMLADNLARSMGMEIQQGQWGAEFGFAQEKEIFNRAVTSQQLDFQERQAAQDALMKLKEMDIQQQQFGQTFGLQEAGVTGTYQGQPTMQAQQLSAALQSQKWDQTMDAWQAELKMDESEFNEWYKRQTLKLDQAKHDTEVSYKAWLKQKGIDEQKATTATNTWLADLQAATSFEEAFKFIVANAEEMANVGVDIKKLLDSMRIRWPESYFNPGSTNGKPMTAEELEAWRKQLFPDKP